MQQPSDVKRLSQENFQEEDVLRRIHNIFRLSGLIISIISLGLLQSCSGVQTAANQPDKTETCAQGSCQDMIFIIIEGSLPENYTVEASDQQGNAVTVHCVNDGQHLSPTQDLINTNPIRQSLCEDDGLHLVGFAPEVVDLTLYWDDHVKSQIVRPDYTIFHSTANNCSPSCKISVVKMHIP